MSNSSMRCPQCDAVYPSSNRFCPIDGETLIATVEALVGSRVGDRYDILARIGQGAHGTVYRARQNAVQRVVAIKVLAADADPTIAARFEAEARALSRLRHPNTVQLIDSGRLDDGRPFLVSPFIEGPTLRARLEAGPLLEAELAGILTQLAGALEEAHAAGVVHRDLKPANVMLESIAGRQVVRLIDFGVARQTEDIRLTADLQTVGTAAYMAPEQIRGESVDGRADLYSLGVLAYECLSGALPFDGPNRTAVVLQHLNDPPPPLPASPLAEIIDWCLEKHPDDRPPDATALIEALTDGEPIAPIAASKAKIWLAAGVVLGLAIMGAFIGWSGPSPQSEGGRSPTSMAPPTEAPVAAASTATPMIAPTPTTTPSAAAGIAGPASNAPVSAAPTSAAPTSAAPTSAPTMRSAHPATRIRRRTPRPAPPPVALESAASIAPATQAPRSAPQPPAGLF